MVEWGETQDVAVTVLVDNQADLIAKSTDTVKRFSGPLLAEHGFAALIDLRAAGVRVLWDAGLSRTALIENAREMEIDLSTIDVIALSHGHSDHTGAMAAAIERAAWRPTVREWKEDAPMDEIVAWSSGKRVPLVAHPAAFRERWAKRADGTRVGPILDAPRAAWEAAGAEIVLSEGPYRLAPGCWTTGAVPRTSFEKAGTPGNRFYRQEAAFLPDHIEDDQSLVIHVRDKGLVILSGCAHAGILNTIRYARQISGVDRVWAVLGGFHLAPANEDEIARTVDEIASMNPALISPTHCTGFRAMSHFAARLPDAFVLSLVGTTYLF